jgi:hypothetical protein
VTALLVGFNAAVARAHRSAEQEAWTVIAGTDPVHPRIEEQPRRRGAFRELLLRVDGNTILFVGNSVVETATVPQVFAREWNLAPRARVEVLAIGGASTLTVLRALELVDRRPAIAIVDLAPRLLTAANENWARQEALPRDAGDLRDEPEAIEVQGTSQSKWAARVEELLQGGLRRITPRFDNRDGPSGHLRALADGVVHGLPAYRCAAFGNVVAAAMTDGSVRSTLLNTTPGYERFREKSVSNSLHRIRSAARDADAVVDALLAAARRLTDAGCQVVFVNMPVDPALRAVDHEVNGHRWDVLARRVEGMAGISFVDAGGDPRLMALPFYDGHHREYTVAREASAIMAELLRPHIPPSLR